MKCPKCKGTGCVPRPDGTELFGLTELMTCDLCHGTGEVELTNEEWFCSLSTEEKVKALLDLREKIRQKMRAELGSENKFYKGDYYREWLKEKHE